MNEDSSENSNLKDHLGCAFMAFVVILFLSLLICIAGVPGSAKAKCVTSEGKVRFVSMGTGIEHEDEIRELAPGHENAYYSEYLLSLEPVEDGYIATFLLRDKTVVERPLPRCKNVSYAI